jgi:hypothetical protein
VVSVDIEEAMKLSEKSGGNAAVVAA